MLANISKYNKAIAAAVGLAAVLMGPDFVGLTADTAQTTQFLLSVLAIFGVYQVPNKY